MGAPLTETFFRRDPVSCARELIGCTFRWHGCEGKIVETEAYAEFDDPACHTWNRPSARDFMERHDAGTAYVYLNYGVHWLFNILTKSPSGSGFVLFRALEPTMGMIEMRSRRGGSFSDSALCSGPGKLTKALGINGAQHGSAFLENPATAIMGHAPTGPSVVGGGRIGISRATEREWRFGLQGSASLSRKF